MNVNALQLASMHDHKNIIELLNPYYANEDIQLFEGFRVPKEFIKAMHQLSRTAYYPKKK